MKKYLLAAAGLVALFAAGYVAEVRHTEKNWYKSGFVTQCEQDTIQPATEASRAARG